MRFAKGRGGAVRVVADEAELALLGRVARDLLTLLGGEPEPDADPLAALVGLGASDAAPPDDPALGRLLPDAYSGDDPEASREFRRYTEADLRAGKRAHARAFLATLDAGPQLVLTRDEADAWLGTLNDLRLVLGTRLEVTEDDDLDDAGDPDDPRATALHVYGWLGAQQEMLLGCLKPRRS